MAPNVTLHFFAANDLNGSILFTLTDEDDFLKSLTLKPELDGLGGGEFVVSRSIGNWDLFTGDDSPFRPETLVRVLVHAYSDTVYYTGFFLDKKQQVVIHKDEDGGEELRFGGPGPKYYLDRAALGIEQNTGSGLNLDLDNGVWRWGEAATAGRVLNRIIAEDAALTHPALPDLTKSFGDANDSDSNAWVLDVSDGTGDFELPIGMSLLRALWTIEDLSDLKTKIHLGNTSAPVMRLDAYNSFGDDVTGTSFGAGVVLLREGVNIAEDSLTVEGNGLRKYSHVLVEGKDGVWIKRARSGWSPGDYVKIGKITYSASSRTGALDRAADYFLNRQDNAEKEITVELLPGADEANGLYFPKPSGPLWLGNLITLDTTADGTTQTPLDFEVAPQLVTGFEIRLGEAGDTTDADHRAKSWEVKVRLNHERGGNSGAPNQRTTSETVQGECCPKPPGPGPAPTCPPPTAGTELWAVDYSEEDDSWVNACGGGTGQVGSGSHGWELTCVNVGGQRWIEENSYSSWIPASDEALTLYLKIGRRGSTHLGNHRLAIQYSTAGGCGSAGGVADEDIVLSPDPHTMYNDNCANRGWTEYNIPLTPPAGTTLLRFKTNFDGAIGAGRLSTDTVQPDCPDYALDDPGTSPFFARSDDPRFDADDQHNISRLRRLLTNNSGGDLTAGAVVVLDGTGFTTTSTAAYSNGMVGVLTEDIADEADGIVQLLGPFTTVVPNGVSGASVGDHLFTSSTPGQATASAGRAAGAVGRVLAVASGVPTLVEWWGVPDGPGGGGSGTVNLQHQRVSVGSVAANSTTDVTVTWATSFVDTNYTVLATVNRSAAIAYHLIAVKSKANGSCVIQVTNPNSSARTCDLEVLAVHD